MRRIFEATPHHGHRRHKHITTLTRLATVGLIGWLCLIPTGLAHADDLANVTSASDAAQLNLRKALADEDAEMLASVFTDDGAVISPDGRVVKGRTTLKASAMLLFMALGGGELQIYRHNLVMVDSTAYETGRYLFKRSSGESSETWQGAYTAIWRRENDSWKIDRAIGHR